MMNAFGQGGQAIGIIAFLVFVPGLWCIVIAMTSLVGGWHELARFYRDERTTFGVEMETGKQFRWASLKLGPWYFPTNYSNCLTIRVDSEGIRLRVFPLFRILHPPLLIPWQDVVCCQSERICFLIKQTNIFLRDRPTNPLRFFGSAGQEIRNVWSQMN
jgi:hypothetical protein